MSALGQKQTFAPQKAMSALPPKADIDRRLGNVCFVPIADIALFADHFASWAARKASESFFSSSGVSLGGSTETVSLLILPVNVKGI